MWSRWIGLCAMIGVLAIAGCGDDDDGGSDSGSSSGSESQKLTKVDLRLNWVIAGNHAPLYLAKDRGYWEECGLDVSMAAGNGSSETAKLVANGSQDFGLTDAVSIIAGRGQGLKIKSIGVLYQSNPSALVSKKDAGITELQNVEGKTWGAVPGGSPYLLLKALFKENGIDEGSIKEVSVAPPGIAQLKTGQVDFITFFGNEAANVDPDPEKNLNVLYFKDAGQDIYGLALATSDEYAQQHADQVKCMQDGVRKGFEAAEEDPDAALKALADAEPETEANEDVQRKLLDGAFEYTGDELLAQDKAKWEATQKVLVDAGIAKETLPAGDYFVAGN
jgi:NitT/TauT family transport system substrate-binding protein